MSYSGGCDKPGRKASLLGHLQYGSQILAVILSRDGCCILADHAIVLFPVAMAVDAGAESVTNELALDVLT